MTTQNPMRPVLPEGTLRIYDNTRLSDFEKCHRYFYFRHERGWVPGKYAVELGFGSAWHSAMDVIWPFLCKEEGGKPRPKYDRDRHRFIAGEAYSAFMKTWESEGMPNLSENPEIEDDIMPRTPAVAADMIWEYIEHYWDTLGECELISVESPFMVPLDPSDPLLWYTGRIDKVIRDARGRLTVVDHKTTKAYKKVGYFREYFTDSFSPNSQVDGYAYAMYITDPTYKGNVMIDAALVHKDVHNGFRFLPVKRALSQLEGWRWETLDRVRELEANRNVADSPEASIPPYMPAFRKDSGACFDYMKACPYLDICKSEANPSTMDTPPGFSERYWSPFNEIDLEAIGLTREMTSERRS